MLTFLSKNHINVCVERTVKHDGTIVMVIEYYFSTMNNIVQISRVNSYFKTQNPIRYTQKALYLCHMTTQIYDAKTLLINIVPFR